MHRLFFLLLTACAILAVVVIYRPLGIPAMQFAANWFSQPTFDAQHVLFTGDVMLARAVERWINRSSTHTVFGRSSSTLARYPEVIVNFEAAVPNVHLPTPDFGMQFSVATATLAQLRPHVTAASLANNHSFDFGDAGLAATESALRQVGVQPFGHPSKLAERVYYTATDPVVAVLGINQLGTAIVSAALRRTIQAATPYADLIVASVHWGSEYTTTVTNAQRELARDLAAAGVDIVIGHHPHVVQPIEQIDSTLVFYSLGNTVFDQYFSRAVQQGLLVGLDTRHGELGLTLYPISSISTPHQPQVLADPDRQRLLDELAAMSDPSLQPLIASGFVPLPAR